jgi:hypothetical protein
VLRSALSFSYRPKPNCALLASDLQGTRATPSRICSESRSSVVNSTSDQPPNGTEPVSGVWLTGALVVIGTALTVWNWLF